LEPVGPELQPGYGEAYLNLGDALDGLSRTDEATAAYEQAIKYNPKLADAYFGLGNQLLEKQNYGGALTEYGKARALGQDTAELHLNICAALLASGTNEASRKECKRAIQIDPNSMEAYGNLGQALLTAL
jgi:protein O-GlcNAc transferase